MKPDEKLFPAANQFLASISILEILPTVQQKAEFADKAIKTILGLNHCGFCLKGYQPSSPIHAACKDCREKDRNRIDDSFDCLLQKNADYRLFPIQATGSFFGYFLVSGEPVKQIIPVNHLLLNFLTILSVSLDNLQKKHALEQLNLSLQISEERYKKAEEVGHVGSWEYDIKKAAFWGSDEGKRVYGFDPETDIFTDEDVMKCVIDRDSVNQALIDLIEKNDPYDIVFDIFPLNSSEKRTINSIAELVRDEKGNPTKVTGVLHDITGRKQAEEEIKRRNEQLQEIIAEKDKFFSIIAHDLRSPFNAFLGFTRLMAEELNSMTLDQIQKIALSMRKSAVNLYNLLDNLLEWSRLQRGVTIFQPELVVLMPRVMESLEPVKESAAKKGIEISCNIPAELQVFTDVHMIQTVIRNLASNAVKYTPKGGKVSIEAKTTDDKAIEIIVKDSGIGMSGEMISNLFRLDQNTNRPGTDGEPSTGLGLIICREFIEKHGGKIWVESEEGKGSTFYFTLPGK